MMTQPEKNKYQVQLIQIRLPGEYLAPVTRSQTVWFGQQHDSNTLPSTDALINQASSQSGMLYSNELFLPVS